MGGERSRARATRTWLHATKKIKTGEAGSDEMNVDREERVVVSKGPSIYVTFRALQASHKFQKVNLKFNLKFQVER